MNLKSIVRYLAFFWAGRGPGFYTMTSLEAIFWPSDRSVRRTSDALDLVVAIRIWAHGGTKH